VTKTPTLTVCGTETIRLARRIRALDANHTALHAAVATKAPHLLGLPGVGAVVAATVLLAWSPRTHPLRSRLRRRVTTTGLVKQHHPTPTQPRRRRVCCTDR
jgi:endonuclease III